MNYKYSTGDRVYIDNDEAIVKDLTGINKAGVPEYFLNYVDLEKGYTYEPETRLSRFPANIPRYPLTKCECGAAATDFPDSHSTWCPKHKEQPWSS